MGIRSDLQLIQQAVEKRWLTDEAKKKVLDTLISCMNSDDDRVRVRATEVIVKMEKQNQEDEHKVIDVGMQQQRIQLSSDQVIRIAAETGLSAEAIRDAERQISIDGSVGGDGTTEEFGKQAI